MNSGAGPLEGMAIGPCRALVSTTGSTKARILPPPSTYWSMAYAASAVSRSGWATISTSMSAGISFTSWASVLTSKKSRICSITTCGGVGRPPPIIAIGFMPPSSGRPVMSPTTRFFGFDSV